jgi:tetratricopeptide (TPR) repeat protein
VSELEPFAREWPRAIADVVEDALERGEVSAEDLRTIVVAPTEDGLALGVWLGTEWEDYPSAGEGDAAAGLVSLASWLDLVDGITRGAGEPARGAFVPAGIPVRFLDEAKQIALQGAVARLHAALCKACELAATEHLGTTTWKRPVGVFTTTSRDREAMPQAFCHPQGAPIWPLQEHREEHGYGSAYPWGSFQRDALVVFYQEGEGESLGDKKGHASIRAYRHADVERAWIDDDDVHLKLRGDVFPVRFGCGHTHEEHGGPDRKAVEAALRGHFASVLQSAATSYELPQDGAALAAWLAGFAEDHDKANAIEELCERHGVATVAPLVAAARLDAAVRGTLLERLARLHVTAGQPEAGLAALDAAVKIDKEHDSSWVRAKACWLAGKPAQAVAAAKKAGRNAAAYAVLALAAAGKRKQAYELLADDELKHEEDAIAARAILLADDGKLDEADRVLRDALLAGTLDPAVAARAEQTRVLGAVLAEHRAWLERRKATAARAAALPVITVEPPRWKHGTGPSRVLAAPLAAKPKKTKTAKKARPGKQRKQTDKPVQLTAAARLGDRVWCADDQRAIVELVGGVRKKLAVPLPDGSSIDDLVAVEGGVLVSDGTRLALLDRAGKVVATAQALTRGHGELAVLGDRIALKNSDAVDLYRLGRKRIERVGTIGMPGDEHVHGLGFAAPDVLAVAIDGRVLFYDVGDLAAPEPRACVAVPEAHDLAAGAGVVAVRSDKDVWLLRARDASAPEAIGQLRVESTPKLIVEGERLWIVERGTIWALDPERRRILDRWDVLSPSGYPMDPPRALWAEDDGIAAVLPGGLVHCSPLALASSAEVEHEVAADADRVRAFFEQTLAGWLDRDAQPIGIVRGSWFADTARLERGAAATVTCVAYDEDAAELELHEREDRERKPAASEELEQQQRMLAGMLEERRLLARQDALRAIMRGLAGIVARAKNTAREVVLEAYSPRGDGYEIVDVVPARGTALPRRAEIAARQPRTLLEQLQSSRWYMQVDGWVARARRDPSFREQIFEVLVEHALPAAARVACGIGELGGERAVKAWLTVATRAPDHAIARLAPHASRPDVRAKLEELCGSEAPDAALAAHRVLGRIDEPQTLELVRSVLGKLDNYQSEELAPLLAAMSEASLEALRDALLTTYKKLRKDKDWQAKELVVPLVRAGVPSLPEGVLAEAKKQAKLEDDDDLFGDEEPDDHCTAVRHFVARAIAHKLSAKRAAGPLWPAGIPAETGHKSWQRFLDVARPRWERAGLLDVLHARLAASAAKTQGAAAKTERHFALHVLLQDLLIGDDRAESFGRALAKCKYKPRELEQVRQLARLGRVQLGWKLFKDKRYPEARKVANAALAEAPADGQVLFFDARLAWMEHDDPAQAMTRVVAALDKATDSIGRGRLYNLYGAALDAVGQFGESIAWFEKALAADPSAAAMLLSNIAEAHWKLGDKAQAARFADQAARRGAKTDIVGEILDATGQA